MSFKLSANNAPVCPAPYIAIFLDELGFVLNEEITSLIKSLIVEPKIVISIQINHQLMGFGCLKFIIIPVKITANTRIKFLKAIKYTT